ncbi:hypothetical protein [Oleiagrimonas sp. C23AA]|uniref:hypothetical protein n=1 Tax=Oleiagrimonas sp. C23AA TaxID=2719047 RepID=UPI001421EEDE|nr:hypothetical protein [Oleiagrimonas sp. C23AA]NII09516.1 hypothetical protein [Oleiagrimonas sp. C23AA]
MLGVPLQHTEIALAMDPPRLSFSTLETRLDQMPQHASLDLRMGRLEKTGLALICTAGGGSLLLAKLLPHQHEWTRWVLFTALVLELVGLLMLVASTLPQMCRGLKHERRIFAEVLDFDLPQRLELTAWLRQYPQAQLATLHAFAAQRQQLMMQKTPLITGSLEKLGVLPLLAALFLQFKDAHWPPHPSWLQVIGFCALAGMYWQSLITISLRIRLGVYTQVLAEAMQPPAARPTTAPEYAHDIVATRQRHQCDDRSGTT